MSTYNYNGGTTKRLSLKFTKLSIIQTQPQTLDTEVGPERLLDFLFVIIKDFECENWMKYPVSTFSNWTHKTHLS